MQLDRAGAQMGSLNMVGAAAASAVHASPTGRVANRQGLRLCLRCS